MSFPRAEGLRTIEFGNPGEQRQRLIDFVVKGNKRATAGILASDYEAEGDLSGDDFRKSHFEFWTSCGEVITDDTEIVTTYFDLIEIR